MKAAVVAEYGGPDVLRVEERDAPEPGPGQVAIDTAFAGVNYAEVMARRGSLPAFKPPFVPGLEVSGMVRAIGDGVEGFSVGDPVNALTTRGGYAEVTIAPATLTFPLRSGAADALMLAAALPTVVPTAWALIHEVARLRGGEDVLVQAAAGGVGTVAGQVARLAGAGSVVGIAGTEEKARYATPFGYDAVFCGPDWPTLALSATNGRGFDVILDSIGGDHRLQSLDLLAPLGRLVIFGNASEAAETGVRGDVLRTQVKAIMGWSITSLAAADPARVRAIAGQALGAVADGRLRVDVTEVLPLTDVARAHRLIEGRVSRGKLVLKIGAT